MDENTRINLRHKVAKHPDYSCLYFIPRFDKNYSQYLEGCQAPINPVCEYLGIDENALTPKKEIEFLIDLFGTPNIDLSSLSIPLKLIDRIKTTEWDKQIIDSLFAMILDDSLLNDDNLTSSTQSLWCYYAHFLWHHRNEKTVDPKWIKDLYRKVFGNNEVNIICCKLLRHFLLYSRWDDRLKEFYLDQEILSRFMGGNKEAIKSFLGELYPAFISRINKGDFGSREEFLEWKSKWIIDMKGSQSLKGLAQEANNILDDLEDSTPRTNKIFKFFERTIDSRIEKALIQRDICSDSEEDPCQRIIAGNIKIIQLLRLKSQILEDSSIKDELVLLGGNLMCCSSRPKRMLCAINIRKALRYLDSI